MALLVYGRPIQLKSGLLSLLLLLPACFTAGQMYQRANYYNGTAGGRPVRGAYSAPQPYWAGRRWNSGQQLSSAVRPYESQRYAWGGTPVLNTQPQMAGTPVQAAQMTSDQPLASPTPSASPQMGSPLAMSRGRTTPYQTTTSPYEAMDMASSYPGVNSAQQPQYSEAFNSQLTREGASQSVNATETGPTASSGGTNNSPTTQYNGGAGANRFNGVRPTTINGVRPTTGRPNANFRYPGSPIYTQSGRTTSSFMGIASGEPYSPYYSQGRQGSQPTGQVGNGGPDNSSTSTSDEESEPTEDEDEESVKTESSSTVGGRRVMNPYDLSHIFPDIYQEEQPASYGDMTSQSLALLEMTTINSDPDTE